MNEVTADTHWSDAQAPAAKERGKAKLIAEPRAVAARYDAETDRIIVDLASGATFAFPPALVEFLQDATPEQRAVRQRAAVRAAEARKREEAAKGDQDKANKEASSANP